jgi:hypothetical protein
MMRIKIFSETDGRCVWRRAASTSEMPMIALAMPGDRITVPDDSREHAGALAPLVRGRVGHRAFDLEHGLLSITIIEDRP